MGPTPRAPLIPARGSHALTLTDADTNGLVEVHPGDHLAVRLANAFEFWKEPDSDGAIIHKDTGGTCSDGSATADFTAIKPGSTVVSSETDLPCFHSRPACAPPQMGIAFFVVVLPAGESIPAPTVVAAPNADTVTVTVADVASVIDLRLDNGPAFGGVRVPSRLAVQLPGGSGSWRYLQKGQYPPLYKVEQSTSSDGSASWIFDVNGDASSELVFASLPAPCETHAPACHGSHQIVFRVVSRQLLAPP